MRRPQATSPVPHGLSPCKPVPGRCIGRVLAAAAVAAVPAAAVAAVPAAAAGDDTLDLFIAYEIARDDNVFRLDDEEEPLPVTGFDARADTFATTEVGLALDLPVSRQQLSGRVALERVEFDRFSQLDHDGFRGNLDWQWRVGSAWSGRLGYARSRTLASLANVQAGTETNFANVLTVGEWYGMADFAATTRWYLTVGAERRRQENSAERSRLSDATITDRQLGLRYETPAGSAVGIRYETTSGDLPNPQLIEAEPVDNSYRQQEFTAFLNWATTPDSILSLSAGRVSREHDDLPARDFADGTSTVAWDWQVTDKVALHADRSRRVSPYEQVNVGLVFLDDTTLRAAWQATDKLTFRASAIDGERRYLADPRLAFPDQEPRVEDFSMLRVAAGYAPTDFLTLTLEWRDSVRDTPAPLGDYAAEQLSFEVRGEF